MLLTLGSFVRLASGGPIGVIEKLDENDNATVAWLTSPPCTTVLQDLCLISASNAYGARQSGEAARTD
jgi:hypothetical protein